MTEPDPNPERDIALEALLVTYGFLLETAFALIASFVPRGNRRLSKELKLLCWKCLKDRQRIPMR